MPNVILRQAQEGMYYHGESIEPWHLKFGVYGKGLMPEIFKNITTWLTTSGIKVFGILIPLIILSQLSKWIVNGLEKFIPEKD